MKDEIYIKIVSCIERPRNIRWDVSWRIFYETYAKVHHRVEEQIDYLTLDQLEAEFMKGHRQ